MAEYIEREWLLNEYDRLHVGPPGGARKMIAEAPAADVAPVVRWISVKDRLPEPDECVVVVVSGKPHKNITLENAVELARYAPEEGWILEMWPEWMEAEVIHWMPLPEAPKEG